MKIFAAILSLCCSIVLSAGIGKAQDDEARQATGLPILVGENASDKSKAPLSGKITIQGLDSLQSKPTVMVIVYFTGAVFDRRSVNDSTNEQVLKFLSKTLYSYCLCT
jgi:hypothetical protein